MRAVFFLLLALSVCYANYANHQQMLNDDGSPADFHLYWNILENSQIQIKVTAKTSGWVGFGFSPEGTMVNSDVIIGWMADTNEIFFDDRFAVQYSRPPIDLDIGGQNNVQLLSLNFVDDWTTIEYSRALSTGDSYDVAIVPGETEVVWAMGYQGDNPTDGNIQRHEFRGVNVVTFIPQDENDTTLPPSCNGENNELEYSGDSSTLESLRVETLAGNIGLFTGDSSDNVVINVVQSAYTSSLLETIQTNFISGYQNYWAVISQRGSSSDSTPSTTDGPTSSSPPSSIDKEVLEGECVAGDYNIYFPPTDIIPSFTGLTYDGNIHLNDIIVSKSMKLQTVGGFINGSFQFSGDFATISIDSSPSSMIIEAERDIGFSGEFILKVIVKGYAGKYRVEVGASTYSISVDGDFYTPLTSSSTSESGYVGYDGTTTSFNITANCNVEVLFYQETSYLTYDIVMPNYNVLPQRTSYICYPYTLPTDQDYHAIRFDAIVEHSSVVHHIVLYTCDTEQTQVDPYDCSNMDPQCVTILYVWAVGGKNFYVPEEAGFPIGQNSAKYGVLQVHYDNPNNLNNVFDNSGIRIYYTTELRQYDAGILEIGVGYLEIPPKQEAYKVGENKYGCPAECMQKHVPVDGEITVFASMLHAHLAGRQIWTEHYRQNQNGDYVQIDDLNHNIYYDFNLQEYTIFNPPHKILPTDALVTYCVYNTMDRNETTYLGLSTLEEMCFNFIAYYPLSDWGICLGYTEKMAQCDDVTVVSSWPQIPPSAPSPTPKLPFSNPILDGNDYNDIDS